MLSHGRRSRGKHQRPAPPSFNHKTRAKASGIENQKWECKWASGQHMKPKSAAASHLIVYVKEASITRARVIPIHGDHEAHNCTSSKSRSVNVTDTLAPDENRTRSKHGRTAPCQKCRRKTRDCHQLVTHHVMVQLLKSRPSINQKRIDHLTCEFRSGHKTQMHHKEEGTDGETDRETLGEIDIVPDEEHVTTGQAPPSSSTDEKRAPPSVAARVVIMTTSRTRRKRNKRGPRRMPRCD